MAPRHAAYLSGRRGSRAGRGAASPRGSDDGGLQAPDAATVADMIALGFVLLVATLLEALAALWWDEPWA